MYKHRFFFRQYWHWFFLLALICLICVIIWLWFHNVKQDNVREDAARYIQITHAMQAADNQEALDKLLVSLQNLSEGNTIFSDFAAFRLAGILDVQTKYEQAIQIYKKLSDKKDLDQSLRACARLMFVSSNLRAGKIDSETALKELKKSASSFKSSVALLEASLLIRSQKYAEAKNLLSSLSEDSALRPDLISILAIAAVHQ